MVSMKAGSIERVLLPIVHVDDTHSANEQLQLVGIEGLQQLRWYKFVNSLKDNCKQQL